MRPFADYHTHTRYSHGKGTIEENVIAAREKGLKEIAITDHGPRHFFIGVKGWEGFKRARDEVEECRHKYPDIKILLGVEANVISSDGEVDVPQEITSELDLILVGYHLMVRTLNVAFFYHLNVKNRLTKYNLINQKEVRDVNTRALIGAVRKYPVKIITHPGLHLDIDTKALALICSERGTALEINCSHLEATRDFVLVAMETGVNLAISSDAHHPSQVGEFDKALELVEEMGIAPSRIINIEG